MASQSKKKGNRFFATSKLSGHVLDVKSQDDGKGAPLIVWSKKDANNENQLFYEDKDTRTVRSSLNNYCFDIDGDRVVLNPYEDGKESQQWRVKKKDGIIRHIIKSNLVIDIVAASTDEGAPICAYEYHGEKNQLWDFEFIDSKHDSSTKEGSSSSDSDTDSDGGDPDPSQKPLTKEERKKRRAERKAERKKRLAEMSKEERQAEKQKRKAEKEKRKAERAARKAQKHKGRARKKSGSGSD